MFGDSVDSGFGVSRFTTGTRDSIVTCRESVSISPFGLLAVSVRIYVQILSNLYLSVVPGRLLSIFLLLSSCICHEYSTLVEFVKYDFDEKYISSPIFHDTASHAITAEGFRTIRRSVFVNTCPLFVLRVSFTL